MHSLNEILLKEVQSSCAMGCSIRKGCKLPDGGNMGTIATARHPSPLWALQTFFVETKTFFCWWFQPGVPVHMCFPDFAYLQRST